MTTPSIQYNRGCLWDITVLKFIFFVLLLLPLCSIKQEWLIQFITFPIPYTRMYTHAHTHAHAHTHTHIYIYIYIYIYIWEIRYTFGWFIGLRENYCLPLIWWLFINSSNYMNQYSYFILFIKLWLATICPVVSRMQGHSPNIKKDRASTHTQKSPVYKYIILNER